MGGGGKCNSNWVTMGFFSGWFSRPMANPSGKLFRTRKEIRQALYHITSLQSEQRTRITALVGTELDRGGVTRYEWQAHLEPIFYRLYQQGELSRFDYEQLKKVLS